MAVVAAKQACLCKPVDQFHEDFVRCLFLPIGIGGIKLKLDTDNVARNTNKLGVVQVDWYYASFRYSGREVFALKRRPNLVRMMNVEETEHKATLFAEDPF
jgi:hypothetical protein